MANQALFPSNEPELHLLPQEKLDQGLWESLKANIRDTFFPEKLPPLQLTSRPVRVREIWGDYNYRKRGALGSMVVHMAVVAARVGVWIAGAEVVKEVQQEQTVSLVAPDISEYMPLSQK